VQQIQQRDLQNYFGESYSQVAHFHDLLAAEGDLRGLLGPREIPRLWERHILNSASLRDFIAPSESKCIVDVGSGAGFPGVVLACLFPNMRVYLVEAMSRRVDWLAYVCGELGVQNAEVVKGRAEDIAKSGIIPGADYATARAVANLKKLLAWTMPLLKPGGELLALKGKTADVEIEEAQTEIRRHSNARAEILNAVSIEGVETTTVVRLRRK
jgi:16S rRNA (guanine527-N7)-methyltransferase